MRNKHDFICISCPLSCPLELIEEGGEVIEIRGADCKMGEKYAVEEFKNPRRTVTTTIIVNNGILPLLPVMSLSPIPKGLVREAVRVLADVVVDAPVKDGQVIYTDILDTGVDIIATRELSKID